MAWSSPVTSRQEQGYPPIEDYGLIGDTRTAALVSRHGSIDWFCVPDFDSDSLFAALLDRLNGGRLLLCPGDEAQVTRRYLDGSPVLETRFETATGVLTVRDFMPLVEGAVQRLEPERQILRILEVERGSVDVEFVFRPRPGYARGLPQLRRRGRLGWTFTWGADLYLLRTDLEVEKPESARLEGRTRIGAGERRYVSLSFTRRDIGIVPLLAGEAEDKLERTLAWWRGWSAAIDYDGPYRDAVLRSALALRLMTFSQSGAVVAAPTSSLPEAIGGQRNWDYRYCWLRDASFILRAFIGLGLTEEVEAFFAWLMHATRQTQPALATLYGLYGRTDLHETLLHEFEGYRGSGPVRWGNDAVGQLQLDVYGSLVTAVYRYAEQGGPLEPAEKRLLRGFGAKVCEMWRWPDDGIWEFRGPRQHTTYSKAMCWAALDRLLRLAEAGVLEVPEGLFREEADELKATLLREAWSGTRRAFTGAFGKDFLDASVLVMPRLGLIDPNDERMLSTFDRIVESLGDGALIRRYEHGGHVLAPHDRFASREGAFGVCCFWAADYLALRGEPRAARARFEALLGHANDLGLYGEEIDTDTGAALGNFPQALTHVGLINAALSIAEAERPREAAAA
jgi:GH15 family glucan-1,4-alpha-glucosidase